MFDSNYKNDDNNEMHIYYIQRIINALKKAKINKIFSLLIVYIIFIT